VSKEQRIPSFRKNMFDFPQFQGMEDTAQDDKSFCTFDSNKILNFPLFLSGRFVHMNAESNIGFHLEIPISRKSTDISLENRKLGNRTDTQDISNPIDLHLN
jgi:hypothetical protein